MTGTAQIASGDILGDKLYEKRAKVTLPILVRLAKAGQTITYTDLADELGMPNPRNLNFVLGCVGQALLNLGDYWGLPIPPIQCVVINRNTKLPGKGVDWIIKDRSAFERSTLLQRRTIVAVMLSEVFIFPQWDQVLTHFGLHPLPPAITKQPSLTEISTLTAQGEGEEHRSIKDAIASNPHLVELTRSHPAGETEFILFSGDRVDVVFFHRQDILAVEVKPSSAPKADLIRGLFQCVKYEAVLNAQSKASEAHKNVEAILALGGKLPDCLKPLRAILGIRVIEDLLRKVSEN